MTTMGSHISRLKGLMRSSCITALAAGFVGDFPAIAAATGQSDLSASQRPAKLGASAATSTHNAKQQDQAAPETIMATGLTHAQRLIKVPQSVSSYSGAELKALNVTRTTDLLGITPGLYVTTSSLSPTQESQQLVIRGVGSNAQLEPATVTYMDGIYLPSINFDIGFTEPERVDIYKGPQNTLFGRNAEAGAVNIITTPPNDITIRRLEVGYDSFNTTKAEAYLSGRIANNLYGSVIAEFSRSDGYITNYGSSKDPLVDPYFPSQNLLAKYGSHIDLNKYTGVEKRGGFRSVLRYTPTDRIDVRLIADYHRSNGNQAGAGPLDRCHCYEITGDLAYQADSEDYGVGLIARYALPSATISSITSWRETNNNAPIDFVGDGRLTNDLQDFYTEQQSKSQEIRIDSKGPSYFRWSGGFSVYKDREYTNRFYILSDLDNPDGSSKSLYTGIWNSQVVSLRRTGYAGYGSVGYDLTRRLHLDAGLRYSYENVDASGLERYVIPANGVLSTPISSVPTWASFNTPVLNSHAWYNASPNATLRYDLAPQTSLYLSYAQGFKSGSYQKAPVVPSDVSPVAPEKTTNYEAGLKSQVTKRIALGLAGYDIDLRDQQVQATVVRNGITSNALTNAGESRITGFEANTEITLTPRFVVSANAAYTLSKFLDYIIQPGVGLAPVVRTGSALPSTPDWTANIRGDYTIPLNAVSRLILQANYRWVDKSYIGSNATAADPIINLPSWSQLDLKVMYHGQRWSASLYANNVLNKYIILSKFNTFFALPAKGYIHDVIAPPALVGFDVSRSF